MSPAHKVVEMDRPIPQNTDAERAVLGAILMDNKALAVVRQILASEDFFLLQHVRIFREILELVDHGTAADLITLVDKITTDGGLETVGGAAYISALTDGLPKVSNVEFYAQIVKKKAALRGIIHMAEAVKRNAFAAEEGAEQILADAETRFRNLHSIATINGNEVFQVESEFEEAQTMKCAIENFLQEEAGNAIAGLSGHGKTWIGLSIARGLLFGPGKLWNWFEIPERAEKVIYLIPESTIGPLKHRLKLMHLYDEIRTGRLLTRTLSKGPTPSLQDPRLLTAAKGAHVICDTAIRFMLGMESENNASEAAQGLSEDLFALLRAGARSVLFLFHSPKFFSSQAAMTLENMIRGSGEFGAALATAWGIKQIDAHSNTIHMQNLKARDFDPCEPFQLIGRPYIDQEGDFHLLKPPGECGSLAEEQPELNPRNTQKHDEKTRRLAIVQAWMAEKPVPSSPDMLTRFQSMGVHDVTESTIKKYRSEAARMHPL